jgi:hypothetical protein
MAIVIFSVGTFVIMGTVAFITFLRFSDQHNATWHWIIAHDRLIRVVTGLSEDLKQAITLEIGVMTAMVASLAIESFQVVLGNVASVLYNACPWQ